MKIAILSDAHDNIINTQIALVKAEELGAEVLLFCGDFVAPGVGIAINKFKGPIYAVFGNNDGDRPNLIEFTTGRRKDVTFFKESEGILELEGRKIAMTHYPKYANAFARTGDYDLVCFGHDHKGRIEVYGECLAVNPGTLNPNPFRKQDTVGFAIYDTVTHKATLHKIDGSFLEA